MKNNVKFITKLVFVLLIILIISACGNNEDELEETVEVHEEMIEDIEFTEVQDFFSYYERYLISTDKRTLVVSNKENERFIESDENKITYELDEEGYPDNIKIYLNDEGIKEFSQLYATEYNRSLPLKKEEK